MTQAEHERTERGGASMRPLGARGQRRADGSQGVLSADSSQGVLSADSSQGVLVKGKTAGEELRTGRRHKDTVAMAEGRDAC